ncbi:hypothetical protein ACFX13_042774 [Malus domestica]|uniref:Uncharacterized protein n=1 Tax=Malus domestica TaxID=3750 RepID=A0A498JNH6_MALDO|nr:uncharacterized protein At3g49140 [Malus domestica]RXH95132.1 hypothetical protein DVH24_024816 [Malus domestica]
MMMIESAMAVRFNSAATNLCSSTSMPSYRPTWSSDEVTGAVHCRLSCTGGFAAPWNRIRRSKNGSVAKKGSFVKSGIRASAGQLGPGSEPVKPNGRPQYHPFEDIAESTLDTSGAARLTAAESARTLIEVNSKATLMFTSLINDEVHENILCPDLPYVTDEHGNIYFQVKDSEDTFQSLTSENNFVQVIIGLDAMEMINEMELPGIDFEIDGIEDEDSDVEDDDDDEEDDDEEDVDYDSDWVAVLEDEDEDDLDDSDKSIGDWAKLETMRYSHPMYFAKKLSEVASDDPIDWAEQAPASLAIQGLIRPALVEEHSVIQKHLSDHQSFNDGIDEVGRTVEDDLEDPVKINGHKSGTSKDSPVSAEELENKKDEAPGNGTTFYKLEMVKIQLFSSHGTQTLVEVEDFVKAQPDCIAHSAAKIISRLKAGGEKTTQALKSLCWRLKGLQVEEAVLIGVDSLGFDLRVCSGTQVQTLRFAHNTRATSEYSAERQLNDLLFPRMQHKPQTVKQT